LKDPTRERKEVDLEALAAEPAEPAHPLWKHAGIVLAAVLIAFVGLLWRCA